MTEQQILNEEITEYNFKTVEPMDNYWSMDYFLKQLGLVDQVTLHDGTYVELWGTVGCHSGGNGDFYSHKIEFEIL